MKKQIAVAGAILLGATILMGGIQDFIWHRYEAPATVKSEVASDSSDQRVVSQKWFEQYVRDLMGDEVPYDYRIAGGEIDRTQILTELPQEYVQIDYTVRVASENNKIIENLELISTGTPRVYSGQMVLRWEELGEGKWRLAEKLRPVEYQIQTPGFRQEAQEPQTEHYKRKTEEAMTCYVRDEVLYVTYDSGETSVEVPDGYERICGDGNGRYQELLPGNSYIVTKEFTGFVSRGASLFYSTDMGQTWQESKVGEDGNIGNTFLSKTQSGYYVTFAVDRALGSDYYATFYSADLVSWERIAIPAECNLSCVFWSAEDYGYYPAGEGKFYLAKGRDAGYQEASIPVAQEAADTLGFHPFDTLERIYQKDGVTYMVVGQGDDGDYAKDGKLMKALYQSPDGENFTFVEEMNDDPEQAG